MTVTDSAVAALCPTRALVILSVLARQSSLLIAMPRSALLLITSVPTITMGLQLPILQPGCNKGSNYINAPGYGVASSKWGHLPRGGWRGAVLGPKGDKIYGIPTNATSVRAHTHSPADRGARVHPCRPKT